MTDLQREREMRTPQFLAVLSVITGWLAGSTVIFEDDFDAYRNSEEPSSIAEIRKTHWRFGEVIDGRYAINHGGNLHQLVMPGVSDFELSFTANPHPRAPFAPILIISFRLTEKKGYRLFHWFGPTWSRVDFHHWDRTADPPADSRLQSIMLPKFALPHAAPIRWRLRAKGNSFALSRNGKEIWSFVHKQGPEKQRGAIALDISTNTRDAVAPIYFDHLKVTTDEIEEVGKHVFRRTFTPPGQIRAMHVKTPFHIDARELRDTGLDRFWTDQPDGRVYRLDLSVDFPEIRGKGRDTAGLRPYVRLETTSGETIFERTIFEGIVGGVMPGRRSGAAMMTRLRNDYDAPKHYGWRVRNCRAADTTGPQKTAIYIPKLPSRFNVAVGWEDLLDADHVSAAGPLEAIFTSDGEPLYSGVPLREGAFSLELKTRPSAGILGRIPKDNQYYAGCVAQQEENHYFVEGEAPVFSVRCVASRRYRLPHIIEWQALDALLRPFPAKGRLNLKMPARGEEHPEWSGRRCIWTAGEIRPNVRHPGIYWLRLQYGGQKKLVCFSIVPGERKPGYTAAAASGLPEISGQFYPMQGWLKETA
ncbi:MAG: hypothetical protein QF473_28135, partial [Planctomycetota bacterium]|nr:hypothetical protein [Planctomycetota bacterium]